MPFVAAAEEGSLTAAARRLRVTTSAVSEAVSRLEADLGVRLLARSPRQVTLTEEGRQFLRDCQGAASLIEVARTTASHAQQAPRGTLKVSLPLTLGELVVAPALPRLLARYPALAVDANFTDQYVDLERGGFDAVVRIGRPAPSTLIRHRLPPIRMVTVAAPSYVARCGVPLTVAALAQHNCLQFVLPTGARQRWLFSTGAVATSGTVSSDHPGALVQLALAGVGLLQVHHYAVAAALADGRLVEALSDHLAPALPLGVLFSSARAKAPRVRAFVEAMDELFQPHD